MARQQEESVNEQTVNTRIGCNKQDDHAGIAKIWIFYYHRKGKVDETHRKGKVDETEILF